MEKRYTIGVLIGSAHTGHPSSLIKGICDRAKGENIKVVFFLGTQTNVFYGDTNRKNYDYQYSTIYDYAMLRQIDVLIIAYGCICIFQEDSDLRKFLAKFGDIPYVLMEDFAPDERGIHIIVDNYGGMRKCVEHLIERHHYRKICYLSGPKENRDAMERLQAYRDVMEEHGLPVTDGMVHYGTFSENVDELVEILLNENPGAEAIVSANDEMTAGIYRVLKKRGLEIGKDIAVTGFDNTEMSKLVNPALTTVTLDVHRMGARSLEMAMAVCRGESVESERQPCEFIPRESCGCSTRMEELGSIGQGCEPGLRNMVVDLKEFQTKSWMIPFIMRDLMLETEDEKRFFTRAVQAFQNVGAKSLYIDVLKEPLVYHKGEEWKGPDALYRAAQCVDGKITFYEKEERPIEVRRGMRQARSEEEDFRAGPEEVFMSFLLYEGSRQYGVLSVEIEPEAISYFFVLTLLFGTVLRFFEMGQKERIVNLELKEKNEVLNLIASYDELTGIYNRRGLSEHLFQFNRKHQGKQAYLLIGDLDHLKQINDNYGHVEGDCAIRTAAGIFKEVLYGIGDIGRFGGDEFVSVFLAEDGRKKEWFLKMMKERCEEYNRNSGKPYYVDISIGMEKFVCGEDVDIVEMLSHADKFLYEAKKNRRKSVKKEENPSA